MIEKTLKTTNGKLRIKIPSALEEVTLGQMMEMQDNPDLNDLEAISILAAIPVDQLKNVRNFDDFGEFAETLLSLSQQIKYLYDSDDIPKKIIFSSYNGHPAINIMTNLSIEPAGAFMAARDVISDEISRHITRYGEDEWQQYFNPSLKACSLVLGHYFFCKVTGKRYNEYEAEEFSAEIKKLRVTEALPVAKHFFSCYPNLSKRKTNFLHPFRQFWRKKQEYDPLKNLSTSTL